MVLNENNIDEVIKNLREQVNKTAIPTDNMVLYLPRCERVLNRELYSGKGRPKNADYDYEEIKWDEIFTSIGFSPREEKQ